MTFDFGISSCRRHWRQWIIPSRQPHSRVSAFRSELQSENQLSAPPSNRVNPETVR